MSSPLLTSGRMFFFKRKTACCRALTLRMERFIRSRQQPGLEDANTYASRLLRADTFYLTGTNGATVVIKDADELSIVATNALDEFIGGTPARSTTNCSSAARSICTASPRKPPDSSEIEARQQEFLTAALDHSSEQLHARRSAHNDRMVTTAVSFTSRGIGAHDVSDHCTHRGACSGPVREAHGADGAGAGSRRKSWVRS